MLEQTIQSLRGKGYQVDLACDSAPLPLPRLFIVSGPGMLGVELTEKQLAYLDSEKQKSGNAN